MHNTLQDNNLKDNFKSIIRTNIEKAVHNIFHWLDESKVAEKDELKGMKSSDYDTMQFERISSPDTDITYANAEVSDGAVITRKLEGMKVSDL